MIDEQGNCVLTCPLKVAKVLRGLVLFAQYKNGRKIHGIPCVNAVNQIDDEMCHVTVYQGFIDYLVTGTFEKFPYGTYDENEVSTVLEYLKPYDMTDEILSKINGRDYKDDLDELLDCIDLMDLLEQCNGVD